MICSSWCSALAILMSKTSTFWLWALIMGLEDCTLSPATIAFFWLDLRACNDLRRPQLSSSNCCPGGTCHSSCLVHSLSRFPSTNMSISARFALSMLASCSEGVVPEDHGYSKPPFAITLRSRELQCERKQELMARRRKRRSRKG